MKEPSSHAVSRSAADINWRRFVLFRVLFNARFYYPVFSVLFLAYGLSVPQFTILNFVWAISIMCLDLPAGALADHIGRRPLIISASVCMVAEMCLLAFAPLGHPTLLFWIFFANRVVSGMAEACASGADEALVFDSLAEQGRSDEWVNVLDQVMRWQSMGLMVAMLVGSAVFDPVLMQHVANAFGLHVQVTQQMTMRFPIYLNVLTAIGTLVVALGLREPARHASHQETPSNPLQVIGIAGKWLWRTPFAILVIVAGVLIDSVVRQVTVFQSNYLELIDIPVYLFGFIGAGMMGIGFFVSPLAKWLVEKKTPAFNFMVVTALALCGLVGFALRLHYFGVMFIIPLGIAMYLVGYFMSYYLNKEAEPGKRATILSFKGLATNLAYGAVGLLYAGLFQWIKTNTGLSDENAVIAKALYWIPLYCAGTILLLVMVNAFLTKRRRA